MSEIPDGYIMDEFLVCEVDINRRTILFCVRKNFGDGKDDAGIVPLLDPECERKEAVNIFCKSLDIIMGLEPSEIPIQRWKRGVK